jgi:hypothetical protein
MNYATIIAAFIALAGSIFVAFLNHRLQNRVRVQEGQLDELYAFAMSDDLFKQLKRLHLGYGNYWIDPEMRYGLGPELNYLKMIGFIKFDKIAEVRDIRELPKGEQKDLNLSDYIGVTDEGRDFIWLREMMEHRRRAGHKASS